MALYPSIHLSSLQVLRMQEQAIVDPETKLVIVGLVKQLLNERPSDPVPFIYSYLK